MRPSHHRAHVHVHDHDHDRDRDHAHWLSRPPVLVQALCDPPASFTQGTENGEPTEGATDRATLTQPAEQMATETPAEDPQAPHPAPADTEPDASAQQAAREARLRARRKQRVAAQQDAREERLTGVARRPAASPAAQQQQHAQHAQTPTAGSLFWGGRLLRQEDEYRQHPATWALRETLKKGSFVAVMLVLWHAGRRYVHREQSAAVVWTTDTGSALLSRRLAFVQGAQSRLVLHRGDVVAAYTTAHARRPVRAVVVDDTPARNARGDVTWKVVPHVARACADGAWLPQGEIVGRIDLSLSPLVLLIFLVLFSLYAWWALSGY